MCGIPAWSGRHEPEDVGHFGADLDLFAYRSLLTAATEHHFYKQASTQLWLNENLEGGRAL